MCVLHIPLEVAWARQWPPGAHQLHSGRFTRAVVGLKRRRKSCSLSLRLRLPSKYFSCSANTHPFTSTSQKRWLSTQRFNPKNLKQESAQDNSRLSSASIPTTSWMVWGLQTDFNSSGSIDKWMETAAWNSAPGVLHPRGRGQSGTSALDAGWGKDSTYAPYWLWPVNVFRSVLSCCHSLPISSPCLQVFTAWRILHPATTGSNQPDTRLTLSSGPRGPCDALDIPVQPISPATSPSTPHHNMALQSPLISHIPWNAPLPGTHCSFSLKWLYLPYTPVKCYTFF